MWTDNETTEDLIGFRVHADLIRSVVLDSSLLPVTIGVFGDWGGGKTSIMKMLQKGLDPESHLAPEEKRRCERVACLYFNGWLFEGYDDAKSAILSAVLMALGEHQRFGPKIRAQAVSLLKSVNWMRVVRLGIKEVAAPAIAAYMSGGATAVPGALGVLGRLTGGLLGGAGEHQADDPSAAGGAGEKKGAKDDKIDWESLIEKDSSPAGPLDVRTFRERFAEMLRESDIDTLVVLIDDLDRCSPERIIENLEAIKLFLNVERTAFVIGADPRIVRHAISVRYRTGEVGDATNGTDATDERLVTDYLEKLIQIPYWLPRLSPAETETYMALLFCRRDLDPERWSQCLASCDAQRGQNRYGTFGYGSIRAALGGGELEAALADSLTFSASSAPLITEGLKGNPRQVKRFLNALVLRKKLADIAGLENVRDDVLVKLMILEYTEPKAFRQLFGWQAAQGGFPKELAAMEEALRESDKPPLAELPLAGEFARRWIRMDPPLAEVDLRDYFWIARDKLESTFTGLSLVPPVVRRITEDLLSDARGRQHAALTSAASLEEAERSILLQTMRSQLLRQPERKPVYDVLRMLVERGIPGALATFAEVIGEVPVGSVPAAVASDLRSLARAKPEVAERVNPVLEQWAKSGNTFVGRALNPAKRARN
jgi:hypothetical protein